MSSDVKPTEVLDVRGEVCPYPDVKTQKKVKSMKSGEILEVLVTIHCLPSEYRRQLKRRGTRS